MAELKRGSGEAVLSRCFRAAAAGIREVLVDRRITQWQSVKDGRLAKADRNGYKTVASE